MHTHLVNHAAVRKLRECHVPPVTEDMSCFLRGTGSRKRPNKMDVMMRGILRAEDTELAVC